MKLTKHPWFWPVFAVGLFLFKLGIIGLVVYVAITQADPVDGPTPAEVIE